MMMLDEQIGQVMVAGFAGISPSAEIVDLIANHRVGGVILFSRNIRDAQQLLDLTRGLQAVACEAGHRYPLLIALDQENGIVRRLGQGTTTFPGNMLLGAAGSEQLTRDVAFASGRELRALGITMNLAPVVDVNNNPANPVIGVRSFGADAPAVARLGSAAVRGYQEAGVMTCLKHFPGHGDTMVDSHLDLPVIAHDLERLERIELVPFRSGIAAGADAVMVAHVAFPGLALGEPGGAGIMPHEPASLGVPPALAPVSLDVPPVPGHLTGSAGILPAPASDGGPAGSPSSQDEPLPATVSPAVVRGLLRERLGFDGVVTSDCMEMSAIARTLGTERGAVLALRAGIDLLFVSHHHERQLGSIAALRAAVESGEIAPETLHSAAERVARLKRRYLSWDRQPEPVVPSWVGGEGHRRIAEDAYARGITLVRDDDHLLPLRLAAAARLLVVYPRGAAPAGVEDSSHRLDAFVSEVTRRHPATIAVPTSLRPTDDEQAEVLRAAARADAAIVVTMNAGLYPEQADLMRRVAAVTPGRSAVGVAVRTPYDAAALPELRTYLATYEDTPPALSAAVRVLWGELPPRGRLPVSLSRS